MIHIEVDGKVGLSIAIQIALEQVLSPVETEFAGMVGKGCLVPDEVEGVIGQCQALSVYAA